MKQVLISVASMIFGGLAVISLQVLFFHSQVVFSDRPSEYFREGSLSPMEKSALMGDISSSAMLARKINDCATLEGEVNKKFGNCSRFQNFWQTIDAENGGSDGASAKYVAWASSEHCVDRVRAVFWLRKLIGSGDGKVTSVYSGSMRALTDGIQKC